MGNRATVVFTDGKDNFSPAVYLHWNGGPESVYGFLEELDRRDVRADQDYECARFVQLVGEFFDQSEQGNTSLGVSNGPRSDSTADLDDIATDHGDNGLYLVNRTGAKLVMRRFTEQRIGTDRAPQWTFKEWLQADVESERDTAEKSDYRTTFREFFLKLAEKPKEETEAVAA